MRKHTREDSRLRHEYRQLDRAKKITTDQITHSKKEIAMEAKRGPRRGSTSATVPAVYGNNYHYLNNKEHVTSLATQNLSNQFKKSMHVQKLQDSLNVDDEEENNDVFSDEQFESKRKPTRTDFYRNLSVPKRPTISIRALRARLQDECADKHKVSSPAPNHKALPIVEGRKLQAGLSPRMASRSTNQNCRSDQGVRKLRNSYNGPLNSPIQEYSPREQDKKSGFNLSMSTDFYRRALLDP